MDKPIAVGDLVQVVKQRRCCVERTKWGDIYQVSAISSGVFQCIYCGKISDVLIDVAYDDAGDCCEIDRLKRIPPLDELEGQSTEEKLKEPA